MYTYRPKRSRKCLKQFRICIFFSQPAFIKHLLGESTFSKFHGQIGKKVTVYGFKETVIHRDIIIHMCKTLKPLKEQAYETLNKIVRTSEIL